MEKFQKSQQNSYDEEELHMKNPRIKRDEEDILYHLALGNKSHDLVEMFGDVKVSRRKFQFFSSSEYYSVI